MARGAQDTRTTILRATLGIVGSEGIAAVTNRNVARRANVALGSVTYHFDTQSTLLREALELFIAEETARLASLTQQLADARVSAEDGAVALQALLEQERERRLAKLELYLHAARDDRLRPAAVHCFEAYDRLAASACAALDIDGADELGPLFVALIDGLQLRRLATGEAELRLAEPLLRLIRGLSAHG